MIRSSNASMFAAGLAGLAFVTPVQGVDREPASPRVQVEEAVLKPSAAGVVLTGEVQARYENDVSFRVSGKIAERLVEVGAHVEAEQVLARLDPDQQAVAVRNAEAQLSSAEAVLAQAKVTFARQQELMKGRYTTQTTFDQAEQNLRVTQAQVDSTRAQLASTREELSYTELRAGVAGIVTARQAEAGQVVQSGQAVFRIAQDGPRDGVFSVYEALLANPPDSRDFTVTLLNDPTVKATARVRETSPTVDATTGSVRVKASLIDPPAGMTLGANLIGRGALHAVSAVTLPWSALFRWQGEPAVWLYDPAERRVSVRRVQVERFDDAGLVLRDGIAPGDRVVTAGIQFLRPGLRVEVASGDRP